METKEFYHKLNIRFDVFSGISAVSFVIGVNELVYNKWLSLLGLLVGSGSLAAIAWWYSKYC